MPVSCQRLPTPRTVTEAARVLAGLVVMSAMAGDEPDPHRNQLKSLGYAALVIYAPEASSACAHNAQPQSLKDDSQASVSCGYPSAAAGKSFCRMVCWVFSLRAATLRRFCVQQLRNRRLFCLRCVKGSGAAACETACLRNDTPHFFGHLSNLTRKPQPRGQCMRHFGWDATKRTRLAITKMHKVQRLWE
jgi:hypothetical protein